MGEIRHWRIERMHWRTWLNVEISWNPIHKKEARDLASNMFIWHDIFSWSQGLLRLRGFLCFTSLILDEGHQRFNCSILCVVYVACPIFEKSQGGEGMDLLVGTERSLLHTVNLDDGDLQFLSCHFFRQGFPSWCQPLAPNTPWHNKCCHHHFVAIYEILKACSIDLLCIHSVQLKLLNIMVIIMRNFFGFSIPSMENIFFPSSPSVPL
mmetsp:Transcript_37788/g.48185  ORF Transcript_37788/g.48185 Transcript_37788/m.48185 type:complete len:209 (-) Transcript_37788:372-998(-)